MSRRKRTDSSGHMIGGLFTFALFGMFVVLSLLIVVIGADGYRSVVDQGDSIGAIRTTLGYISGKLNSVAGMDGVIIGPYGGVDALTLVQYGEEGESYETVIYCQDGSLYELFFDPAEMDFDPEYGDRLVDIAAFEVEAVQDHLLRVTVTEANGRTQTLHVALRGGQEVTRR